MLIFLKKVINYKLLYILIAFIIILYPTPYVYAIFSCGITTSSACAGTVMLRMSGSTNAHAELPNQSTPIYDGNVVCCIGVTGISNSCAESNKEIFAKLSNVTNAHIEIPSQSNYNQNLCLSSPFAGDVITVGSQASDCAGYDTILFSMVKTPTNSQVGIPSAYNNKICAKVVSQSISFSLSNNTAGFGGLTPLGLRYATSDGIGSSSEAESYNITINTNASSGYGLYVSGDSLKKGVTSITPIGAINTIPTAGSNSFGIRAVATGGIGSVSNPYNGTGFAYDANSSTMNSIGSATSGNGVSTVYSIRTVATINALLDPGSYSTDLTYIVTANF